jgi:hypothetical protein
LTENVKNAFSRNFKIKFVFIFNIYYIK